jgi:hypothetical protein
MRSKPLTWAVLLVAILGALAPLVPSVQADELAPDPTGGQDADKVRLGPIAAIACGFFVRATIATGGAFAGTIAGAVASCGFMLFMGIIE